VLQECFDPRQLRKALKSLPNTLNEMYSRILASISVIKKPYAIRILQFLTYSERPLTLGEAVDTLAVFPNEDPSFDPGFRMPESQEITSTCSSLISIVAREPLTLWESKKIRRGKGDMLEVRLAHFSVKEYLLSEFLEASFQQSMVEVTAKNSISQVCIAYILYTNGAAESTTQHEKKRFSDAGLDYDYVEVFFDTNDQFKVEENLPLIGYTAKSWIYHADCAISNGCIAKELYSLCFEMKEAFKFIRYIQLTYEGDAYPTTPLIYASRSGCSNIVKFLLQKGAVINDFGG
jgi:hypothetical protein